MIVRHRVVGVAVLVCLSLVVGVGASSAQFWDRLTNPQFTVPITHPPQLVLKGVTRIAINEITGQCGTELGDKLGEVIAASQKFELLDRANLQSIFDEKKFHFSGSVDSATASRLGQMIGAAAMIFGNVSRCSTSTGPRLRSGEPYKDNKGIYHQKFVRKTKATLIASLQIVDLTSGKIYTKRSYDGSLERATEAIDGDPEPYDENQVLTDAYAALLSQFCRVIMPWTETVKLTVYDDDKYGLKLSSKQMKAAQFAEAAQTVKNAIDAGGGDNQADKKLLSKAYYNLGIAMMYSGTPEEAAPMLQKSLALRSADITNEAITACNKMISLKREGELKEATAVEIGAVAGKPAAAAPPAADAKTPAVAAANEEILTNEDIIDMIKAKMSNGVILAKIKSSRCNFNSSTKALVALKNAGASDTVLQAVAEAKK